MTAVAVQEWQNKLPPPAYLKQDRHTQLFLLKFVPRITSWHHYCSIFKSNTFDQLKDSNMKRISAIIAFISFLSISGFANATPLTNATIMQQGDEYSAISRLRARGATGWYKPDDGTIYTNWSRHWAEYTAYLTEGIWAIGLNVVNHGNLGHNWYDTFKVRTSLTSEIMNITANDNELSYGLSTVDILSASMYTVRYTWLNDKWGGQSDSLHRDANIQIQSAFFNRVPEPSTLLLFSLGLVTFLSKRKIAV